MKLYIREKGLLIFIYYYDCVKKNSKITKKKFIKKNSKIKSLIKKSAGWLLIKNYHHYNFINIYWIVVQNRVITGEYNVLLFF